MLQVEDKGYYEDVRKKAEEMGILDKLEKQIKYLSGYGCGGDEGKTRCRLWKDFAPHP